MAYRPPIGIPKWGFGSGFNAPETSLLTINPWLNGGVPNTEVEWNLLSDEERRKRRGIIDAAYKGMNDSLIQFARKAQGPDAADVFMRTLGTATRRGVLGSRTLSSSFLSGPSAPRNLLGGNQ